MEYTDALNNTIMMDEDRMSATMILRPKMNLDPYTMDDLRALLTAAGVKFGIREDMLEAIVQHQSIGMPFCVAQGKPPVDGKDGEFEMHFRTELPGKPRENADGSVDYLNVDLFEQVHAGQKIVTYHKATGGSAGFTLTGQVLMPKKGRELPPLRGKNFHIEEGTDYYADLDGKIEFKNGRIEISDFFEVRGDIDSTVGNVVFKGDVVINGAVRTGMRVIAGGSVTINGVVEGAEITSGGDILLRSGVVGNGRCFIEADGNIFGKFIENAHVIAKGIIACNYLMNSEASAWMGVELEGRKSSIIGGVTSSLNYIKVGSVGNDAELPTHLQVGIDNAFYSKMVGMQKKADRIGREIETLEEVLHSGSPEAEKIVTLITQRVKEKMEMEKSLEGMREMVLMAKTAYIAVSGTAWPRVTIQIDVVSMTLPRKADYVLFRRKDNSIATYSLG